MSDQPLFPYQVEGAKFLSLKRAAILGDEMGLGKTVQAITACDLVDAKRILVLCPAVARANWLREFQMWSDKPREFYTVIDKATPVPINKSVISSYDLAHPDRITGEFDVLILDECHYLKNISSRRTHCVFGKWGLIRRAKRTWALSGTPAPNHPGELWPILYTFGTTKKSYDDFVLRYCRFYETSYGKQITGARVENLNELSNDLKSVMLRRRKDEVMTDLPPITYGHITVEPGPVDLSIEASFTQYYIPINREEELFEEMLTQRRALKAMIDTVGYNGDGLRGLEAMAQSVATVRRYIGLQKLQPTVDIITEEMENSAYDKLVIFAIHRDVIENLRKMLSKFGPVTLYGGTPPEKRTQHIERFQKNPKCRIFIGNIQAAGTAITLTSAHNVIFIEQDWVPGNNAQAAMRCHRIGQTKPVVVRFIGLADGLDEKITYLLKRKTKELTKLFDEEELQIFPCDDTTPTPDLDDIFS